MLPFVMLAAPRWASSVPTGAELGGVLRWTQGASDALLGVAYLLIAGSLIWLWSRIRRTGGGSSHIPPTLFSFGLVVLCVGLTRLAVLWRAWDPGSPGPMLLKVAAVLASFATGLIMLLMVPRMSRSIEVWRTGQTREREVERTAILEHHNAELNAVNQRLELALDHARSADKAKSDFLAVMSHELRTPLNAIMGYTELMELGISGPVSPTMAEQLGHITTSSQHLLGLIDQVLTFARLDAGAQPVHVEPVELRDLARDVVTLMTPLARARGLQLELELPPGPVPIVSDPLRVRQVVMNLLSNAIKFTPRGRVTLTVRAGAAPQDVAVDVADTGVGLSEEAMAHVFDPFWQADSGLTRSAGGTGLGLSVSRGLAELLGGTLAVSSLQGEGSTFTLSLPIVGPSGDTAARRPGTTAAVA